ncbi:uncharacterized protein LOC117585361 [Drosophila guanche]|uniref:Uncharacterized protein n=1 Tax=Drosophila guanche TaxID=7266 RepID=A0A3B0JNX7_DROGU|nr:uncharacterized protein LOC117585361 [Drosophila guanche]SPP82603.1 Hypothetical predicted protein [Drosophila guanche]
MVLVSVARGIVKALMRSNTFEEIAQIMECDVESVVSCIKECQLVAGNTATFKLPTKAATVRRPHKMSDNVVEQILRDHLSYTSLDVQRELMSQHGMSDIESKAVPVKNVGLSVDARNRRVDWALAHQDWSVRDWRNVFNMDDQKFVDGSPPKQIFVDTLVGPEGSNCNDRSLGEQLMAIIQPKIQAQAPKNTHEFRAVLYDAWHSDQEIVDKIEQLYESMPGRVQLVLLSGGDNIEL